MPQVAHAPSGAMMPASHTCWNTRRGHLSRRRGHKAGGGACYVKFGAVRPGPGAERTFGLLIDACHGLAADRGAPVLVAGANAGRDRAWRALTDRGFRRDFQGVTMHRPNEPGYSTSDSYVIDDWR